MKKKGRVLQCGVQVLDDRLAPLGSNCVESIQDAVLESDVIDIYFQNPLCFKIF